MHSKEKWSIWNFRYSYYNWSETKFVLVWTCLKGIILILRFDQNSISPANGKRIFNKQGCYCIRIQECFCIHILCIRKINIFTITIKEVIKYLSKNFRISKRCYLRQHLKKTLFSFHIIQAWSLIVFQRRKLFSLMKIIDELFPLLLNFYAYTLRDIFRARKIDFLNVGFLRYLFYTIPNRHIFLLYLCFILKYRICLWVGEKGEALFFFPLMYNTYT